MLTLNDFFCNQSTAECLTKYSDRTFVYHVDDLKRSPVCTRKLIGNSQGKILNDCQDDDF